MRKSLPILGFSLVSLLCVPRCRAQTIEPDMLKVQFAYGFDIAARTQKVRHGSCANRPFTHDAAIWSLLVRIVATPPVEAVRLDPNFPVFHKSGSKQINLLQFAASSHNVSLTRAGREYKGEVKTSLGVAFLEFENLSLSEIADVVELLTAGDVLGNVFESANVRVKIYPVIDPDQKADPVDLFEALYSDIDPIQDPDALARRLDAMRTQPASLQNLEAKFFRLQTGKPSEIRVDSKQVPLDTNTIVVAKENVKRLSDTGQGSVKDSDNPPIFIIDEPCLQFVAAPTFTGQEIATAVTFRARYDYLGARGRGFLKFRGEGEGSQGGNFFQRIEIKGDGGLNRKILRSVLAFGSTGTYSFTRQMGQTLEEWRAGGKLQIHAPSAVGLFGAQPGAATSPIFNVEFNAVGGDASSTQKTSFMTVGNLLFTSRPNTRLSIDVNGSAGWSNDPRFATQKNFSYAKIQFRFNVNKDWDYIARYDCGRKPPDYMKFCGWQSGLTLVMGR